MNRLLALLCLGGLASVCVLSQPKLIRVPQDQPTIQAGIDAAINGDTVLVAEGTYFENIRLNKKIVLGSLYILDGDTAHIPKTILDGSSPAVWDSASVIRIGAGTDTTTVVKGFTIQKGRGTILYDPLDGTFWKGGGGIALLPGAGARICKNILTGNNISSTVDAGGRHVFAGGIAILGGLFWIIEDNQIVNNILTGSDKIAGPAGVWLTPPGRFEHNIVSGNVASSQFLSTGGGIECGNGQTLGAQPLVIDGNIIRDNTATNGSALRMYTLPGSAGYLEAKLVNNVIADNKGGVTILINAGQYQLINNTVVMNTGTYTFRLLNSWGPLAFMMLNNIVWNPNGAEFVDPASGSHNIVRGGLTGAGNLNVDPDLEPHSGYYFLREGSPARNAGVQSATLGGYPLTAPSSCFQMDPWWSPPLPIPTPIGPHTNVRDANPDIGAHEYDPLVGVEKTEGVIPTELALSQNYPNPFNPTTTIEYQLPSHSHACLKVFNMLGQELAVLVDEVQIAGYKAVQFDASGLPSGVYVYRLQAGDFVATKKLVLLK